MRSNAYGLSNATEHKSVLDLYKEEILLNGFTIIDSVFSEVQLSYMRSKIDEIYEVQQRQFGEDNLERISDLKTCRCPIVYDETFLEYATTKIFIQLSQSLLDEYIILNLQNANLSLPNSKHQQSQWHRDISHQNFTSSKPLALNFLVAIDEFTESNGGVVVLPYSHKFETMPSKQFIERHMKVVTIPAGSVVAFDSMLIHRAGYNHSENLRRSMNHVISRPFIKQQYDFSAILKNKLHDNEFLRMFSGYTSMCAKDDKEWRNLRMKKYS